MPWLRLAVLGLALLLLSPPQSASQQVGTARPTAHITSQTTTTLLAGLAGTTIGITSGSVCVDGNGATTAVQFQDSTGFNIAGPNIVYVLNAGQCLWFPTRNDPYWVLTTAGAGLQLITTVGNGPVEVTLEVFQR